MKYKLYRSLGNLDRDIKKHVLVAVEIGKSIEDVENELIRDVTDDLAESEEYKGCDTSAYAPEPVRMFRRVKRYSYEMTGVIFPPHAEKNILIDYGVIEEAE